MGDDNGSYYDDKGQEYIDDDYERYDVRHPNTEKDKSGYYGDEEDSYDLNDMDDNNKNNNSDYLYDDEYEDDDDEEGDDNDVYEYDDDGYEYVNNEDDYKYHDDDYQDDGDDDAYEYIGDDDYIPELEGNDLHEDDRDVTERKKAQVKVHRKSHSKLDINEKHKRNSLRRKDLKEIDMEHKENRKSSKTRALGSNSRNGVTVSEDDSYDGDEKIMYVDDV